MSRNPYLLIQGNKKIIARTAFLFLLFRSVYEIGAITYLLKLTTALQHEKKEMEYIGNFELF